MVFCVACSLQQMKKQKSDATEPQALLCHPVKDTRNAFVLQ